ncbi:specifically androgen-regulated gene protein [Nothobranchius furzeri]|uniref:Transcript variant X1 n=2 Tax=Nothobranchius furzeri TaxID=105023 RepID=A0A9D2YZZ4_NOTFU|nr:transcript variant X1 [Nothobranchius furzeri]KAF7229394.1 transcript variant X2 [Nothobranchius furzeri]
MDVRLQGNSSLHYGVNGGARRNPSLGGNNTIKYLSKEEQDCLQFFEDTIESLEESLERDQRPAQVTRSQSNRGPLEHVDGLPMMRPNHGVNMSSHQDIIDLVHSEPDLVQNKDPIFNPINPDFHCILQTPESHFGAKLKHNLPSEYDGPLPGRSYGHTDSHSSFHPPGSIPTPVLIAQKIAENQGEGTAHPSTLLQRLSLEKEKPQSNRSNDPPRYPPNINVLLGSKEQQKPVAKINIHERQEQMLANLSGSTHPLVQEISQQALEEKALNSPSRSYSFKNPEPDKSRMEALSKLGLNRTRATSFHSITDKNSQVLPNVPGTRVKSPEANISPTAQTSKGLSDPNSTIPPLSYFHDARKAETRRSQENPSSPTITQNKLYSPPPTEVASMEFNSYGGKSIIVQPTVSTKSEPAPHPTSHEPKNVPSALSNPPELNPYGGKTKVMTPAPINNLPDILSSHMDQTSPTKLEPHLAELNIYGGKSRSINPIAGLNRSTSSPAQKPPPPATAPRPPRNSYHGIVSAPKPPTQALSPDYRRKPSSMFRPQGITVQFCGRGAMNESRREALRKLGLLKDS